MTISIAHAALTIAAALFDSLWEGILIAGTAWLGLRCLPQLGASTRYAIWLCVLAAIALIPALTAGLPAQRISAPLIGGTAGTDPGPVFAGPDERPHIGTARVALETAGVRGVSAPVAPIVSKHPSPTRITVPQSLAVGAALFWALVACARGLMLLLNFFDLARTRRNAWLWSDAYDYPVLLSTGVRVPIATGFFRPAVILPEPLVEQLSTDTIETIIVHEIAHLRRYDVWTNAFARVVEAFAALNPAAWFVMRKLSVEREIACDDWVVACPGASEVFARALATMAGNAGARAPLAAPSAIGSRNSVVVRIESLLDSHSRRIHLSLSAVGGTLMLLALIALIMQTVSPVLAYTSPQNSIAQHLAAVQIAGSCAVPNRAVRIGFSNLPPGVAEPSLQSVDPNKIVARFGAANVATVKLMVDNKGVLRKVDVLSAPRYPGMVQYVTRMFTDLAYKPALHNCAAVPAAIQTGVRLGMPQGWTLSVVAPAYPDGWSEQHRSSCKVPNVLHVGVPAFPGSMGDISMVDTYKSSVRVHVDSAGAVTSASIVTSSGKPAFDDALLSAARSERYPLREITGFKPVRPSHTSLSWNASHGSNVYAKCNPLPNDYVWSTTFQRIVPHGLPGRPLDGILIQ